MASATERVPITSKKREVMEIRADQTACGGNERACVYEEASAGVAWFTVWMPWLGVQHTDASPLPQAPPVLQCYV
jgi:hypothetical protein